MTGGRRQIVGGLFLGLMGGVLALQPRAGEPESLGKVEMFEELAGESYRESHGYYFSISPDEEWIVSAVGTVEQTVWVLHLPTRRKWTHKLVGAWYPNCFSEDSSTLYFGEFSAELAPDMEALELSRGGSQKDQEALEATFLGFNGVLRSRDGVRLSTWGELTGSDRVSTAWGPEGRVLYEVVGWPREGTRIRVTPPGEILPIDFQPVIDAYRQRFDRGLEKHLERRPSDEAFIEGLRAKQDEMYEALLGDTVIQDLSVAPNGRWLSANRGLRGAGPAEGILIRLDGPKRLRAWLYAPDVEGVRGTAIWSADSQRLYFLGLTEEQGAASDRISSVYRLQLREGWGEGTEGATE